MSKRFVGKTCVYCGAPDSASTRDHIFAREFFLKSQRQGLPLVAACWPCNNAKSSLEHYLATVLPFGGRTPASSLALANDVPRRLAKNQKLHRELIAGHDRFVVTENGVNEERLGVPFDSQKLLDLFAYIARGLSAHHWGVVIPSSHRVEAVLLNPFYEPHFRKLFLMRANARVNGNVANGTFLYQGAQGIGDPALGIWRFQALGGIVMAGDERIPEAGAYTVWVTTARGLEPLT